MRRSLSVFAASILATITTLQAAADDAAAGVDHTVVDTGTYTAQNGKRFSFVKERVGNDRRVTFRHGDLVLDRAGMRRYEATHLGNKVDPTLLEQAAAAPDQVLPLLVWLDHQPAARIARATRQVYRSELDALAAEVREVQRTLRPPFAVEPDTADAWFALSQASAGGLSPGDRDWLKDRARAIEDLRDTVRREIAEAVHTAVAEDQAGLDLLVAGLGGQVRRTILIANAAAIVLPAASLERMADDPRVARIEALKPGKPELDLQKRSLGLDLPSGFWDDGFDGATYDAGVLDTGVQQDHPALDHLSFESMVGTTDADGHGTAITGIMASNDADLGFGCLTDGFFCGMAWGMDTLLAGSSDAMDVLADADWMVTTATEGPEAINLSAGYGTADDVDYSGFDAFFDALVDVHDLTLCTSAGDGGIGAATTLTHPANAYNVISVANMDDQNTTSRDDDVSTASSGRGPTLGGRKKPDLSAPGELTRTTDNDWATGPDFVDVSGTSAAAPHCTGAALLLADQRGTADPLAVKAALINAADSWTDGGTPGDTSDDGETVIPEWNSTYGWGYLDLARANRDALNVFSGTIGDGTGAEPTYRLYTGDGTFNKLTLTWNRHVGFAGASEPSAIEDLTDLDLEIYSRNNNSFDTASASLLDNVEQAQQTTSAFGPAVAKVTLSGPIDPDVGVETFAIASERSDWIEAAPPGYDIGPLERPPAPGRTFRLVSTVTNTGDVPVFDVEATLTLPAGYTLIDGQNPQTLGEIVEDDSFRWTVQAACNLDATTVDIAITGSAFGESFAGDATLALQPVVTELLDDQVTELQRPERAFAMPVEANRWTGVAIRPRTPQSPMDLWADDDLCVDSPYQTSTSFGQDPELVLANGAFYGDATHTALVRHSTGQVNLGGIYWIERQTSGDLVLDVPQNVVFDSKDDVVEILQLPVIADRSYAIRATPVSAFQNDLALLVYDAGRDDGDVQNPDVRGDDFTGTSTTSFGESVVIRAAATGNMAVVLFMKNRRSSATYEVTASEILFVDGFESGDTSAWSTTVP